MPESSSQKANRDAANASVPDKRGRFVFIVCRTGCPNPVLGSTPAAAARPGAGGRGLLSQAVMRLRRAPPALALPALALPALGGLPRTRLVLFVCLLTFDPPAPQADHRHDEGQREQEDELALKRREPLCPRVQIEK